MYNYCVLRFMLFLLEELPLDWSLFMKCMGRSRLQVCSFQVGEDLVAILSNVSLVVDV